MMENNRALHSLAVGKKMYEIGKEYNLSEKELEDLFILGTNHDIGYEYTENGVNHAVVGGEILKRNGYKYWQEVYYHGDIKNEYNSLKRLLDIKNRHGENSEDYKRCKKVIENILGHEM